jgi:Xaa-Pro aminopeptidase
VRGFSTIEFKERLTKARLLMQENKFEMILITSSHNFRYFTGFDSYFWESPARPWFLLLSLKHDPIAIIPSIGETALQKTWIQNIITWQSPNPKDEGLTTLQDAILSIQSNKCLIGCEKGLESHLRMSINDFQQLNKNLSNHNFVDASPLIWKLRMIKSKNEITKIKRVISIASKAFDELPNFLHIGQTEVEICNIMKKIMLDLGADYTLYMSCASGKEGYDQIICEPTDKQVQKGDIIIIDTGTTWDGYFCDFDRNYCFGNISERAKSADIALWEAAEKAIEFAKPGVTCSEISNIMITILQKAGLTNNNIGRMGHGLGLQLTEPPSIMPKDNTILQPGMVITIEPCLEYASGKMLVHEEDILITEEGCDRLTSRTPEMMPIIK